MLAGAVIQLKPKVFQSALKLEANSSCNLNIKYIFWNFRG